MEKLLSFYQNSDKYFIFPLLFSSFCIIIITGSFLVTSQYIPNKLPIFYSLPWGQSQLISKDQFLLLPILILLVSLFNSFLASQLHPSQFILKRIIMFSLISVNLIILITAIKILFIFI